MILNKDNFLHINEYSNRIFERNHSEYFNIKSWDDKDYFYIEFCSGDWILSNSIESIIPLEYLNKIKQDDYTFLVICHWREAFANIVDNIYRGIVIQNNIPPKKIILMTGGNGIHFAVKKIASKYNLDTIQVEWSSIFEYNAKMFYLENYDYLQDYKLKSLDRSFQKLYLNLNRRWRLHRLMTVWFLYVKNLLDKGFVSSFNGSKDDLDEIYPQIIEDFGSNNELGQLLEKNEKFFKNFPNLYLDNVNEAYENNIPHELYEKPNQLEFYYSNSFFSLVSETFWQTFSPWQVDYQNVFITEKTMKPIIYSQPFIIMSSANIIGLIHELGYKTFHPYINETYDKEINDVDRFMKIFEELTRLSNLSMNDLHDLHKILHQVTEHNITNLLEKNQYVYKIL